MTISLRISAVLLIASATSQAAFGTHRPLSADQAKALNSAREYARAYTAKLPNFICTQITKRDSWTASTHQTSDSGLVGSNYGLSDEIVEKVTYFDQKENYEVVSINKRKAAGAQHGAVAGATSAGEFGSALRAILDPKSNTVFSEHPMAELRGRHVYVFAFQVPKEAGIPISARNTGQEIVAPYHGLIFFDNTAKKVLRITTNFDLPHGFPIDAAWRVIDYEPATIAGQRYNLPADAEVHMQSGTYSFVNKIVFKDYREFAVESTIRFGTLAEAASNNAPPVSKNGVAAPSAVTESVQRERTGEEAVGDQPVLKPAEQSDEAQEKVSGPVVPSPTEANSPEIPQLGAPAPRELVESTSLTSTPNPKTAKLEPETNENSTLRLRLSTDLVLVPVVVKDASGRVRMNLSKEDFQVFDKGKRQEITSFMAEKGESQTEETEDAKDALVSAQNPAVAVKMPVNYVVYLFDDLHLKVEDLVASREAARRNVETLPATDLVAVLTTSGLVESPLTTDREKFKEALLRLHAEPIGKTSEQKCPDIDAYMANLILNEPNSNRVLMEAAVAETVTCLGLPVYPGPTSTSSNEAQTIVLQAARAAELTGEYQNRQGLLQLKDVVRWLAKAPGRRSIVLISPGFVLSNSAQFDGADVVDAAIRADVAISALDARGVYGENPAGSIEDKASDPVFARMKESIANAEAMAAAGVMGELAEGTGGTFIRNTNDLYGGLQAIATPPACTYVLGFKPANLKKDGSFHPLVVKLNTKDKLNVQTRRGYFATKQ